MSSRARRFPSTVETAPFPWAGLAQPGDATSPANPVAAASAGATAFVAPSATQLSEIERDAFAKGYEQGERSGMEAGRSRADAMLRRMASTLEELAALRQQMIHHTEQQMVQLALSIAKRIVRREVTIDPDLTVAMARVALDRLGEHSGATIRLHPEDHALAVGEESPPWDGDQVTVVSDESIGRGGCRIESAFGFIEAGVEAQFEEIEKAVLGEDTGEAVAAEAADVPDTATAVSEE